MRQLQSRLSTVPGDRNQGPSAPLPADLRGPPGSRTAPHTSGEQSCIRARKRRWGTGTPRCDVDSNAA